MEGYSDFTSRSMRMGREICYCGLWKDLKRLLSFREPRTRSPKTTAKLIYNNVYFFLSFQARF